MKITDIVLISDIDGTILPASGIISDVNKNAVRRFRELGGKFTIATGRSPISARCYFDEFEIDGAVIANNGATIYDVNKDETVWCKYLSPKYRDIIKFVRTNFKDVGIEIVTDDGKTYIASCNDVIGGWIRGTEFSGEVPENEYPDCACKILFVTSKQDFRPFVETMRSKNFDEFEFVESGGECFEMMEKGINKGYPLKQLVDAYGRSVSATIGDYHNDIDMIKNGDIGAAVGNACKEAKGNADIIVSSCEDDGLAEFIEYLIDKCE